MQDAVLDGLSPPLNQILMTESAKMRQMGTERESESDGEGSLGWRDLVLIKTSKAMFSKS